MSISIQKILESFYRIVYNSTITYRINYLIFSVNAIQRFFLLIDSLVGDQLYA